MLLLRNEHRWDWGGNFPELYTAALVSLFHYIFSKLF